MPDLADQAQQTIELEASGELAKAKKPEGPERTGLCAYCGEAVANPIFRWCNTECRNDWDDEQRLLRMKGKE
jgi:hypothetical protein